MSPICPTGLTHLHRLATLGRSNTPSHLIIPTSQDNAELDTWYNGVFQDPNWQAQMIKLGKKIRVLCLGLLKAKLNRTEITIFHFLFVFFWTEPRIRGFPPLFKRHQVNQKQACIFSNKWTITWEYSPNYTWARPTFHRVGSLSSKLCPDREFSYPIQRCNMRYVYWVSLPQLHCGGGGIYNSILSLVLCILVAVSLQPFVSPSFVSTCLFLSLHLSLAVILLPLPLPPSVMLEM